MTQWWGSREKSGIGPELAYKVLQADLIRPVDRERAVAIASFVTKPADAYKLAGHEGFRYVNLDEHGRCGLVQYRGMDVLLLFKLEVVKIPVEPGDPIPERAIKEPDAWIQISLLNTDDATRLKGEGEGLRKAMASADRLRSLWKAAEADKQAAENRAEKLEGAGEKFRQAKEEILLLKANLKGSQSEIESLKREVQQQKEAVVSTKKKMVEEIFPIFNTVWLAGVHRVGDQLYGILKKQMTDALSKIGVNLIEPTVGELFDPTLHDGIHSHSLNGGAREIGCVTQVHRVGWRLGKHVMAAAEVSVGVEKRSTDEDTAVAQEQQRGV